MQSEQIREIAEEWIKSIQSVERIEEGNLNEVWRIRGSRRFCIIKYAPPHVASQPGQPLSQHRARIEARALRALSSGGELEHIPTTELKVPDLWGYDDDRSLLIMEEVSYDHDLGHVIRNAEEKKLNYYLEQLGEFIARLHSETCRSEQLKQHFDNRPMQETRREVQYAPITEQLRAAGIEEAEKPGKNAAMLGEQLLKPGKCLIMGDLWPSSVLVSSNKQYLIDWELAHYGRPLQDIGHLAAHLWLQSRVYRSSGERVVDYFVSSYREAMGEMYRKLWDQQEKRGMCIHMGAEMIVRILGAFSDGFLEGFYQEDPLKSEVLQLAVDLLRGEDPLEMVSTSSSL